MKINPTKQLKHIVREYKLGDFLRNFIAVVLGIIITFAGSDWVMEHNTQKEVKKALQLVKAELQLNREEINGMREQVTLEQRGARYLMKYQNKMNEASKDSLSKYTHLPFQLYTFHIVTDAMEMLKGSALIQKINDKEFAIQIIKTYSNIKSAYEHFQNFNKVKEDLQTNLSAVPEINHYLIKNKSIDWDILFKRWEAVALVNQIPQIQSTDAYNAYLEIIDETIAAIEKEYS